MDKLVWLPRRRPPAWRLAAAALAVFFVMMGSSKILAPRPGASFHFGSLAPLVGTAEIIGGLMLLVPGSVSHGAFLLVPVVCVMAMVGFVDVGRAATLPTAPILAALVALGFSRRPQALIRARLERALDRVVRLESARTEGVQREGF